MFDPDEIGTFLEVGQALTYAHECNIIHGNIKPENILFNAHGHALLTDFSPVKRRDALIRDQAAEEYAFCYQAPEQFSGTCNAGSDQYALGCLAYELIAGQVPFAAQGLASLIGAHSQAQPAPLSESVPDLPPALEAAVMKTLAKDPTKCFVDCLLFLEVLQSIASLSPVLPFTPAPSARSTRTLSHARPSAQADIAVSPIRERAEKRSALQQSEPSQAFFNSEADRTDAELPSGFSDVSMPAWAGIIAPSESIASRRESDQSLSLPSEQTGSASNREKKRPDQPLKEQRHTEVSVMMLRAHEIDMREGEDANRTNAAAPDFRASQCCDDAVFPSEADSTTNQTDAQEDADDGSLTHLLEKQEHHDLPVTGSVSLEQELHEADKEKKQEIVVSLLNEKNKHLRRQKQHTRRTLLGLMLLCLVIAASGMYVAFFPWRTSLSDWLVRPTPVVKEVLIPIQKSLSPTQFAVPATSTATAQPTPQITTIPIVAPTPTPIPSPVVRQILSIDDSVQGTGLNQFNYVGNGWGHCTDGCGGDPPDAYDRSNSWDNTVGDYVTVSFTGIQIKFYTIIDPKNHGIEAVSLEGGSEMTVSSYGFTTESYLLWTSPMVPEGPHTFKLRVLGSANNPAGPHDYTVVDRVDILS